MSERIEDDEAKKAAVQSMVGRTIVGARFYPGERHDGDEGLTIELDDGRTFDFDPWGHDWWGLNVSVDTPDAR